MELRVAQLGLASAAVVVGFGILNAVQSEKLMSLAMSSQTCGGWCNKIRCAEQDKIAMHPRPAQPISPPELAQASCAPKYSQDCVAQSARVTADCERIPQRTDALESALNVSDGKTAKASRQKRQSGGIKNVAVHPSQKTARTVSVANGKQKM